MEYLNNKLYQSQSNQKQVNNKYHKINNQRDIINLKFHNYSLLLVKQVL
jgi:hypothetical protein